MFVFSLFVIIFILGTISVFYNNKFLLSVIISLEFLLLNTITLIIYSGIVNNETQLIQAAIFILALSAIEASIGVSIVALLSRNLSEVTFNKLNALKN
uniref:NADH-ubiquinone oxidoreductase chain 4L n=1 Tax=Macrophiothrix sp. TaxID=3135532 RepID=A0AAU6PXL4_9ECHI